MIHCTRNKWLHDAGAWELWCNVYIVPMAYLKGIFIESGNPPISKCLGNACITYQFPGIYFNSDS